MSVDLEAGLTSQEAALRLARFGSNALPERRRDPLAVRVGRQFAEPMAFLLLVAAAVAGFGLGMRIDAVAILVIVVVNALIALLQEGKAANALAALRSMETPTTTVRRDGSTMSIPSPDVVPGDILVLAAGDRVPADARLVVAASLEMDEAMLTGESLPVPKGPDLGAADDDATDEHTTDDGATDDRADRNAVIFAGTLVVRGSGRAVVFATGARSRLGAIAERVQEREPPTPLQRELRSMTTRLGLIAVVIALAVFALTFVRLGGSSSAFEIAFLSAAALAVAAVPEGLPTVVTVALALGVRRMASRGSIVRRLPAVETLGSTTVILSDKTGTLTQNRMHVDAFVPPGSDVALHLSAAAPVVEEVLALCNDATLHPSTGDPTEIALLDAIGAARVAQIRGEHPRLDVLPFDSERKWMTTVNLDTDGALLLMKGAPEVVLPHCTTMRTSAGPRSLDDGARAQTLAAADVLASRGARVLALAVRALGGPPTEIGDAERDLVLLGLVTLRDPVRPEAAEAVAQALSAGISIVMVTGDHPGTARAVAQEVGLAGDVAMTGRDVRKHGFPEDPLEVRIYARVDPDEKLALTEMLQAQGHVVAVTGDGVNDAPALRRADIGVAMGMSGSDVAREAADMVVTDDNLATIVHAVHEGRGIYDNIRKVVEYLVAGNLSEIMVVVGGLVFFPALGVPLLPLQLLWINLLTDGFPALALSVDPVDPGLMARPPRARADHLLSGRRLSVLLARGVLIAGAALGSLTVARYVLNEPWHHARASMFSVLMTAHLLYAFSVRSDRRVRARGNPWLVASVVGGLVLQAVVVSAPAAQGLFGTASLSLREWALVAVAGVLPTTGMLAAERARARWVAPRAPRGAGPLGPPERGR